MIDHLKAAGLEAFRFLLEDLRLTARRIGHRGLNDIDDLFVGPVDPRHIGAAVELKRGIVTQPERDRGSVGQIDLQSMLRARGRIWNGRDSRTGKLGVQPKADLFDGFHGIQVASERTMVGADQSAGLCGGSRSCSPNSGTGHSQG